jgi:hypothetical protein
VTPEEEKKVDAGQKEERKAEAGLPSPVDVERRGPSRPAPPGSRAGKSAGNQSGGRGKALPFGTHTPVPGWAEFMGADEEKDGDSVPPPTVPGD